MKRNRKLIPNPDWVNARYEILLVPKGTKPQNGHVIARFNSKGKKAVPVHQFI